MKVRKFEDLLVWQKAQELAVQSYQLFGGLKDFSFKDQICRATVSISNNIAEGFERSTNKDFIRMLYIAKGSAAEVKSMLYLAERLNYIEAEVTEQLRSQAEEISKMIRGLIKSIS